MQRLLLTSLPYVTRATLPIPKFQRRGKGPRTYEHVLDASIVPDDDDEMDAAFELSVLVYDGWLD